MTEQNTKAYLVGGGVAALAAAVFLIRDVGLEGSSIRILEELDLPGGSLDGTSLPAGYVTRGGRMLEEEAYTCLWDLLETIPTLSDPGTSMKQEIWEFNKKWPGNAQARLINADHEILDAATSASTPRPDGADPAAGTARATHQCPPY